MKKKRKYKQRRYLQLAGNKTGMYARKLLPKKRSNLTKKFTAWKTP